MSAVTKAELEALVKRQQKSLDRAEAENAKLQKSLGRATTKNKLLSQSLKEALEQQTATADVLKLISRTRFELQPVLDTLVRSAAELCEAQHALYYRIDPDGLRPEAWHNVRDEYITFRKTHPIPVASNFNMGRATLTRQPVHIHDLLAEPGYGNAQAVRLGEMRTVLGVPVLRQGDPIGVIGIFRQEVRPFTQKQIELVTTFADQAAIAIQNVRLFNETKEALAQQTVFSEILRIISSSPTDTEPVFDAIVRSGQQLFGGMNVTLRLVNGDDAVIVASMLPEELKPRLPFSLNDESFVTSRTILRRELVHVPDVAASEWVGKESKRRSLYRGNLAMLSAPLMRKGEAIGAIGVTRATTGPFTDRQIELLKTFADQAVIAIENARLFKELQARNAELTQSLERQTATSEVLKIISRSTFDLEPVLHALLDNAARLCRANRGVLFRQDGDVYPLAASYNATAELQHLFQANPIVPGRGTVSGRAMLERQAVHVADVLADPDYQWSEAARVGNYRTVLGVPLLREGVPIGVMGMTRDKVEPFTDQEIALVTTFADQAVIAIENVRLFKELQARNTELTESLEQQTATGEILRVISQSPTDVQPVFDTIAESAARLCESLNAVIFRRDGDRLAIVAHHGPIPLGGAIGQFTLPLDRGNVPGRSIMDGQIVHVADLQAESGEFPEGSDVARRTGFRTALGVPLMREGVAIGVIVVRRAEAQLFSDRQVELLKTFADQAVIAIENVRLFRELEARNGAVSESLARQTATADILRIISTNPTDVQPVLDAVAESAARLCGADDVVIRLVEGETHRPIAHYGTLRVPEESRPLRYGPATGRALLERRTIHVDDVTLHDEYEGFGIRSLGVRTFLVVPLLREDKAIGAIVLRRLEVNPFSASQIELLETFAAQAVIAIENVRLFHETKEALERQTATAEILKVIAGSPSDTQPVFDAIVKSGLRLFGGMGVVMRLVQGGQIIRVASAMSSGLHQHNDPMVSPIDDSSVAGRAIMRGETVQAVDCENTEWLSEHTRNYFARVGYKSAAFTPMMRDGVAIGALGVVRGTVGSFDVKHIDLLRTFADQAVIAIENVRLFKELQARNAEITEALKQQTATAEILRVISSSPTNLQPMFDAILEKATQLCDSHLGLLGLFDGEYHQFVAVRTGNPDVEKWALNRGPFRPRPDGHLAQVLSDGKPYQAADLRETTEYRDQRGPTRTRLVEQAGVRSILSVPMLKEGHAVGAIAIYRAEVRPFTQKEIDLVSTFANQAVIAIENVRLFKELQAQTEALSRSVKQLTALGEVGQAISSSLDLETVLKTIVSRALLLTGLDSGSIYEYDPQAQVFRLQAAENMPEEIIEPVRNTPVRLGDGVIGRIGVTRELTQVADILDESYQSTRRANLVRAGYRALLAVPLLRDEHLLGVLLVHRKSPGEFALEVIDLLKTFATQSALAIQNARLFREIAEKGRQLEVASQHKSQFLASMSHELRTPLNAILGFNEMILGEIYGDVPTDMQAPLAQMQTSGKHLLRLINNVLDLAKIEAGRMELSPSDYIVHEVVESVRSTLQSLAADKGLEFAVVLPADLLLAHGDAGRITQCLMNLAGNSIKFTKEGKVEITVECRDALLVYRVADTGMGIPPEKIGSLFTEFKQTDASIASEFGGTGLGLSISKKFIEMHGGRIWVESELGKGSTFIFEIPLRLGEGEAT